MYLSRIVLPESVEAVRLLADWHRLHHAVLTACPRGAERTLFRLEPPRRHGEWAGTILVQSERQPEWNAGEWPEGTRFDPPKAIPTTFSPGHRLRFRLRANPTVKKKVEGKHNGRREGVLSEQAQLAWLMRKAEAGGFRILSCVVIDEKQLEVRKPGGQRLSFRSVLFEGTIEVVEPNAFLNTIEHGIGPGKAFGFGLLSVAPVESSK